MTRKLKNRREFELVYERGAKGAGKYVVAFLLPRELPLLPEDPASVTGLAVGIVASRRVGGAVQRNRAKRVLRVALRAVMARVRRPAWLVLVARASAASADVRSQDLVTDLAGVFERLGCLESGGPAARGASR